MLCRKDVNRDSKHIETRYAIYRGRNQAIRKDDGDVPDGENVHGDDEETVLGLVSHASRNSVDHPGCADCCRSQDPRLVHRGRGNSLRHHDADDGRFHPKDERRATYVATRSLASLGRVALRRRGVEACPLLAGSGHHSFLQVKHYIRLGTKMPITSVHAEGTAASEKWSKTNGVNSFPTSWFIEVSNRLLCDL